MNIDTAGQVGALPGLARWLVVGTGFVAMHRARRHSLGQAGCKNYLAAVIKGFYQIAIRDTPVFGVCGIQTDNPIGDIISDMLSNI